MPLTSKELSAIEDQLGVEQTLVKKFALYAQMTTDPQLKTQFEQKLRETPKPLCTGCSQQLG